MKREEANGDRIRPGDVYKYICHNDQGYGYMIPVKTSGGWDFIDTYQLGIPWSKDGETSDDASIRRIIELGHGEHDGYVSNQTSLFYHRNAYFGKAALIDRPTCHNVADYTKESFRCSECGCRVLVPGDRPEGVLVVTSEAFPVDWYSCPVCGAVVGE